MANSCLPGKWPLKWYVYMCNWQCYCSDTCCSTGSGGTDEYGVMVDEMMSKYPDNKFIAVGFSMGGNIVVKYLGEHEYAQSRFIGAISCCQGYDIVESVSVYFCLIKLCI